MQKYLFLINLRNKFKTYCGNLPFRISNTFKLHLQHLGWR